MGMAYDAVFSRRGERWMGSRWTRSSPGWSAPRSSNGGAISFGSEWNYFVAGYCVERSVALGSLGGAGLPLRPEHTEKDNF